MSHLRFAINRSISDAAKIALAGQVGQPFAKVMGSGTDHISIWIHDCGTFDLSIDRVTASKKGVAIVEADIRRGRTIDQRRVLKIHKKSVTYLFLFDGVRALHGAVDEFAPSEKVESCTKPGQLRD